MTVRMIARGRHVSTVALVWAAAFLLVVADVLALAGDGVGRLGMAAFVVATVAGFLVGTALLRGLGSLVARIRISQALAAHGHAEAALIRREVALGIAQIEAFLAEQHTHGA
jgi:ABC-type Na+ efflux pump permease subunit